MTNVFLVVGRCAFESRAMGWQNWALRPEENGIDPTDPVSATKKIGPLVKQGIVKPFRPLAHRLLKRDGRHELLLQSGPAQLAEQVG